MTLMIHNNRPQPFSQAYSLKPLAPKFGYAPLTTPWAVGTFDYTQLGNSHFFKPDTPTHHSMFVYFWLISSRIIAAFQRGLKVDSQRETAEHALRDTMGYTMWFFGSAAINRGLSRLFFGPQWKMLYSQPPSNYYDRFMGLTLKDGNVLHSALKGIKKLGFWMFGTSVLRKDDIEALGVKQLHAMSAAKLPAEKLAAAEKLFNKFSRYSGLAVTLGIVFNIALMGFGIPYVNILFTKREGARLSSQKAPTPQTNASQTKEATVPTPSATFTNGTHQPSLAAHFQRFSARS